jgi:ABC-type glycerol-3-phosphate transport system substrate-binding protein
MPRRSFWTFITRRLIPQFEQENPGIRIRHHTSLGDAGYDAKLLTLIAGKLSPDLIHVTQNNFPILGGPGCAAGLV